MKMSNAWICFAGLAAVISLPMWAPSAAARTARIAPGKPAVALADPDTNAAARISALEQQNQALRQIAADAEARREAIEKEQTSASAHIKEMEQALARAGGQARLVAALEQKLAEAEARRKAIEKEKASASAQCEALRAAAEKEQKDSEAREARLHASVAAAVEQQAAVAKRLEVVERENKDFARQLELKDEQVRQLTAEKNKLEKQLAGARRRNGDELLVREERALREQIDDPANPALVWSLNDAALVMMRDGRLDEAELLFRRALALVDQRGPRSGPVTASLIQHLADTCWQKGQLESAESFYRESAALMKEATGESHPRYAAVLNGLAGVLHARKQDQESETLYRKAVAIYGADSKAEPFDVAVPSHNLGVLLIEQGRYDEAGPLLQKAAQLAEEADDARTLIIMRSMSRFYQRTGNVEQAALYESRANELAVQGMMP